MIGKLWNKYVAKPLRLRRCADYGFVADQDMDALCERFDMSLREMWFAKADAAGRYMNGQLNDDGSTQAKVDKLVDEQKTIQDEGGQELRDYLSLYFIIVKRSKAGEWGKGNPPTTPDGWKRFRTANNWRD